MFVFSAGLKTSRPSAVDTPARFSIALPATCSNWPPRYSVSPAGATARWYTLPSTAAVNGSAAPVTASTAARCSRGEVNDPPR